ncbi:hypothetical protein ABAC402_05310 [Asticcacaulis sp. AC402]|nr:hypothetical protein ABAC402_05310 [Asticcacaulis sp. AC402]
MVSSGKKLAESARSKRRSGDNPGAVTDYTRAEAAYTLEGDKGGRAYCLRHRGDILRELGQTTEGEIRLREAERLYRQLDDPLGLANTLRCLALMRDDIAATALWLEARLLYQSLGVEAGIAEADCHLVSHSRASE